MRRHSIQCVRSILDRVNVHFVERRFSTNRIFWSISRSTHPTRCSVRFAERSLLDTATWGSISECIPTSVPFTANIAPNPSNSSTGNVVWCFSDHNPLFWRFTTCTDTLFCWRWALSLFRSVSSCIVLFATCSDAPFCWPCSVGWSCINIRYSSDLSVVPLRFRVYNERLDLQSEPWLVRVLSMYHCSVVCIYTAWWTTCVSTRERSRINVNSVKKRLQCAVTWSCTAASTV